MNQSPFTLVYRARAGAAPEPEPRATLAPELLEGFRGGALRANFIGALTTSTALAYPITALGGTTAGSGLSRVMADLKRAPRVQRVGLWDIGARVARLPDIIERLNASQPKITFFQVHAPVPAGLIRAAPDMVGWLKGYGRLSKAEREEIQDNFLVGDFYPYADRVRRELGLDYIIGITGLMLAGEEDDEAYWNYFATSSDRTLMASAYDVATYARRAKRPYEAAVAGIAVSILLARLNPKIEYHDDTRGCLFDMNVERALIVRGLRNPHIDNDCFNQLLPAYREAATALLDALREYDTVQKKGKQA